MELQNEKLNKIVCRVQFFAPIENIFKLVQTNNSNKKEVLLTSF